MIGDCLVTDHVIDQGLIGATMVGIKGEIRERVIEAAVDKRYNETEDMAACLEKGVIPNVILTDGKGTYELEIPYKVRCER